MAHGKRSRQAAAAEAAAGVSLLDLDSSDLARILLLFSGSHQHQFYVQGGGGVALPGKVFECKTCSRRFPSFQALGGHRASHKKPRVVLAEGAGAAAEPPKPKVHGCSVCGLKFAVGQALGGHMRRHRAAVSTDVGALGLGHGLTLGLGSKDVDAGKKSTPAAVTDLQALDLNAPALEEEADRDKLGLAAAAAAAVVVDFRRR